MFPYVNTHGHVMVTIFGAGEEGSDAVDLIC
jgi:hypothetical protein